LILRKRWRRTNRGRERKEKNEKKERKREVRKVLAGNTNRKGRLSKVDLLVLTSLDRLLFIL
jgi:hypothetical protein